MALSKSNNGSKSVRVEYRGDYRIVGLVCSSANQKLGYAVIDTKSNKMTLLTTNDTVRLLEQSKFENAELNCGEILITECSENRLLKFDTRGNVIGNKGITILGRILNSSEQTKGFRVLTSDGSVKDLPYPTLVKVLKDTQTSLINGKLVVSDGKPIISAIKGTFKSIVIETSENKGEKVEIKSTENKTLSKPVAPKEELVYGKPRKYWHKKYLDKRLKVLYNQLLSKGYINRNFLKLHSSKKTISIVLKEFVLVHFPQLKHATQYDALDLVTVGLLMYIDQKGDYIASNGWSTSKIVPNRRNILLLASSNNQVIKLDKPVSNELLSTVYNSVQGSENTVFYLAVKSAILNEEYANVKLSDVSDKAEALDNPRLKKLITSFKGLDYGTRQRVSTAPYNPIDFDYTSEEGIKEFGYTIHKEEVGVMYSSVIYGDIHLRDLFEGLSINEFQRQFLIENIQCFGDVEILRKIVKHKGVGDVGHRDFAQTALFILAMHNLPLADFINQELVPAFALFSMLEVPQRERFTPEDILYYHSGMKFGMAVELKPSESWAGKGLNHIPAQTYHLAEAVLYEKGVRIPEKEPYTGRE